MAAPLWRAIAADLQEKIETELWRPGAQEHGAVRLIQADQLTEGTTDYLRTLGVEQYGYQDLILSRQPRSHEIEFFRLPSVGVPILEHRRTSFTGAGEPIRITVTAFP